MMTYSGTFDALIILDNRNREAESNSNTNTVKNIIHLIFKKGGTVVIKS